MSRNRLTLVAAAGLVALGLTACGSGGGTVTVGKDGVALSDGSGGQVSVGADGATGSDGNGNSVVAGSDGTTVTGADGSQVSVGAGGATVASAGGGASVGSGSGGGVRQGSFGANGQLSLSGAMDWQGTTGSSCDVNGDQRTITATIGDGYTVVVDTNGTGQASITVSGAAGGWAADFNGDAGSVVTLTPGRTLISGAELAGDGGNVALEASFAC